MVPVPEIQMEWDEASCGQLVWLYNEAISHYDGHTESFFNALARPDRLPEPGEVNGRALRVASIDIGGGTTDMAVVHYQLDDGVGANVKITPHLLFREGFKVAGDDLLLDVIQRCVLPALQTRLQQAGLPTPPPCWPRCLATPGASTPKRFYASKRRYSCLCRSGMRCSPRGSKAMLTTR